MNLILKKIFFVGGTVLVITGVFLSFSWIAMVGIVLYFFSGWPQKPPFSVSSSASPDNPLSTFHALCEDFFAYLANQHGLSHEEKKDFFQAWKETPPHDIQTIINLFSQAKHLFKAQTLEKNEDLISIQKAFYKLPYLRILLLNVIEKTEDAANVLIERFISISEKNRLALEDVQKRIATYQGDSLSTLIGRSTEITQNYQHMKEEYESLLSENKQQIEDFSHQIQIILHQLNNINEILRQNKIIAVNLAIEGVKFGEKGRAIKVIVKEIQKLNQKIDQFTSDLSHHLEQFESFHKELWNNWLHHMENSVAKFQIVSDNASKLITKLKDTSEHMNDIVTILQKNTASIQKDLDTMIESLQFQDITRQQIENVISYLGQIQDDIKKGSHTFSLFGITFDEWNIEKMDEAKDEMVREAKVSSERFLLK